MHLHISYLCRVERVEFYFWSCHFFFQIPFMNYLTYLYSISRSQLFRAQVFNPLFICGVWKNKNQRRSILQEQLHTVRNYDLVTNTTNNWNIKQLMLLSTNIRNCTCTLYLYSLNSFFLLFSRMFIEFIHCNV